MKRKPTSASHVPKGLRIASEGPGLRGEQHGKATASDMDRFGRRVLRLVARIPIGRVATYGQIAALAGHPHRARHVGRALAGPHAPNLPWHRVINAQGRVSARAGEATPKGPTPDRRQQKLLEAEGVDFNNGALNLELYRWRPEEEGGDLLADLEGEG